MPYLPFDQRKVSEGTGKAYVRRAISLADRFYLETGIKSWLSKPRAFLEFFERIRTELKTASWRQYKASLTYWFSINGYESVSERFAAVTSEGCITRKNGKQKKQRTSSKKLKGFPAKKEAQLISYLLEDESSSYSKLAAYWLKVGIVFGARPNEWLKPGQRLFEPSETPCGRFALVIPNAKHDDVRSHGEFRTLFFEKDRQDLYDVYKNFVSELGEHLTEDESADIETLRRRAFKGCQDVITKAGQALWPDKKKRDGTLKEVKRPTLYSGRHQFVANAVAAGCSWIEIAAMLGHATDKTARRSYGKKARGTRGGFHLAADPNDMKRVRVVYKVPDFMAKRTINTQEKPQPTSEVKPNQKPAVKPGPRKNYDFGPSM